MKIELSHDILARKIYEKASAEDKMILKIERLIADDYERYQERNVLMGKDDYEYVAPFLTTVNISKEENQFLEKSYKYIERKKRNQNFIVIGIIGLLTLFGGIASVQSYQAQERARDISAKNHELRKQRIELELKNDEILAKNDSINKQQQDLQDALNRAVVKEQEAEEAAARADVLRKAAEIAAEAARKAEKEAKDNAEAARKAEKKAKDNAATALRAEAIAKTKTLEAKLQASRADSLRIIAILEKEAGDSLRDLAQAIVVANRSIRLIQEGKLIEGAKLALVADSLNVSKNGPKQNPDTYAALEFAYRTFLDDNRDNLNDDEISPIYKTQDAAVRCIATSYSPSRKVITAYATEKERLYIVDSLSSQRLKLTSRPRSMTFSHNGRLLIVGTYTGDLLAFEYTLNQKTNEVEYKERRFNIPKFDGSISYIEVVEPSPGRFFIAFAGGDRLYIGTLHKDQRNKKGLLLNIKGNFKIDDIQTATFSPDGKYLFAANKNTFQTFEIEYNLAKLDITTSPSLPIAFDNNIPSSSSIGITSTGEHLVAVGFKNGSVRIANIKNVDCLAKNEDCVYETQTEHKSTVTKLLFSNDARQLISSGLDQVAKIWNIQTYNEQRIPLIGHRKWIWDIAYSKEEDKIYTVSEDRSIKVWEANSKSLSNNLRKEIIRFRTRNKTTNSGFRSSPPDN